MKRKLILCLAVLFQFIALTFIYVRMAIRADNYTFTYWPMDMQIAGVLVMLVSAYLLYMSLLRNTNV